MSEDLLLSSAITLLAAILIAAVLLRRRARLGAAPARGSRLSEFGENIRLRDLFRLAVIMEEEGRIFYLKMADKATNEKTKQLCALLAEEESLHKQFFTNMLTRWKTLNVNPLTWPAFLERVKKEGFYAAPPAENASEEQLALYAIGQEIKSAEFYQLFEEAFPQDWRQIKLHTLVLEERSHETKLRAAYPQLK